MKKLNCSRCGKYLGEIEKGKIKLYAVLVCKDCNERIKIAEATMERLKATGKSNPLDEALSGFKNIFGDDLFGSTKG